MESRLLEMCSGEVGKFSQEEMRIVLSDYESESIDRPDKGGMTALMHCAYRGNRDGCSLLLEKGANVNLQQESDGYTPLMFATIAGKTATVQLLLEAGAKTSSENKIGKTAAQLGAFVGQHDCVQVINNYFSLSDLLEYASRLKSDGKPCLPDTLATSLHKLLTTTHIHPVHLVMCLESSPELLERSHDVTRVLETVSKDCMNDEKEEFSLKAHYLSFLLAQCVKEGGPQSFLKRLLCFTEGGVAVEMDTTLRQCLREFPHHHSVLLKQLVKTLAKVKPGGPPSALSLFVSAIVGEKAVPEGEKEDTCATCGLVDTALKKCSRCKQVWYCGVSCQKLAWSTGNHRRLCKKWTQS